MTHYTRYVCDLLLLMSNRGVRRCRWLFGVQVPRVDIVSPFPSPCLVEKTDLFIYREKGDASKTRDFLPSDKQYLVTRGVPCLRRATSLAYTNAGEDAERLLSFADTSAPSADGDEWVETHAGRQAHKTDSATNAGEIVDIPDLDGDGPHEDEERIAKGLGGVSLGAGGGGGEGVGTTQTPDLDDSPDMEEDDLEEGDDEATAAAPKASVITAAAGVVDARYVLGFAGNQKER